MYRMSLQIPQARVKVEKVFTIRFLKGYFCVVNPPPPPPKKKKQKKKQRKKNRKPPSWEV